MKTYFPAETRLDSANGIVYLVDDDEAVRDALIWLLHTQGIPCTGFAGAEDFLAAWTQGAIVPIACLVLDVRMPGMGGAELFSCLQARGFDLPVIFLTGHGDVPQAVAAIRHGAFDYLEKPCDESQLCARIRAALAQRATQQANQHRTAQTREDLTQCLARLTERERAVMRRILEGKRNKVIAEELGIALRTVEVHRAHIFEKMAVRSAVGLAQRLAIAPESRAHEQA